MILIGVLMVGAIAGLMAQIGNTGQTHPSETPVRVPAGILYTAHDPINIWGNVGFTGPNSSTGITRGSGTVSDPYVIEGWEISWGASFGISITSADVHFVIHDCYVHDIGMSGVGFYCSRCSNGTVKDCIFANDYEGIVLQLSGNNYLVNNSCSGPCYCGIDVAGSDNNSLINNNCSKCYDGIGLWGSSNNTLINNNCSGNYFDGMILDVSSNNTISNNTCSNNSDGIELLYSTNNNTVSNNTCCSNKGRGIHLDVANNNTLIHNNCSSNIDHGITLDSGSSNNVLIDNTCNSNEYGGIWLDIGINNTLSGNNCSSNYWSGIYLFTSSNDNTLINNICCSNSHDGIGLDLSSDNNEISLNLICNNAGYGVNISSGSNNRIWNNTFTDSNGAGTTYDPTHVQAYDDGTNNWWNTSGTPHGYGNYWSDLTTPDANGDGIVDDPFDYIIAGGAGAKDYYPRTTLSSEPIPEFGMMPFVVMVLLAMIVIAGETRRKKKS